MPTRTADQAPALTAELAERLHLLANAVLPSPVVYPFAARAWGAAGLLALLARLPADAPLGVLQWRRGTPALVLAGEQAPSGVEYDRAEPVTAGELRALAAARLAATIATDIAREEDRILACALAELAGA